VRYDNTAKVWATALDIVSTMQKYHKKNNRLRLFRKRNPQQIVDNL
jgi:hypothetical protein